MYFDPTLYLITDSTGFSDDEFLAQVESALQGGVTLVQLREKTRTAREYLSLAQKLHCLTTHYGVPLLIDDRLDIAMAIGAEGVHLGQDDLPISDARRLFGSGKIIGATAKNVPQALEAQKQGADYLGVGAIYPTSTKVKTVLTSVETLKAITDAVTIPVCAIGGLNADNLSVLNHSGISGICAVSALMKAQDAHEEADKMKRAFLSLEGRKEIL